VGSPRTQELTGPASTLIIMPAHNEAANLPHVLAEIKSYAPGYPVLVIDDASVDDTPTVAAQLGASVVSLSCNLGYGGALQTGFKYAVEHGYGSAVMLDADGQHDPRCIPDLVGPIVAGEADVVVGSRFLGEMRYRSSWPKRLGMAIFGAIAGHVTHRTITDATSGFQALNRDALCFFARGNYPADYPDADTLLTLYYAGFHVIEVPVCMRDRLAGVSMHSSWRIIYYICKMFLSILVIMLRQRMSRSLCGQARSGASSAVPVDRG